MHEKLTIIQKKYSNKIHSAKTLGELDELFIVLFGKSGQIDKFSKQFKGVSKMELKKIGPLFNQIKKALEAAINQKRGTVREQIYQSLQNEKLKIPSKKAEYKERNGHLHPLTQFEEDIVKLFEKLGFVQTDAPQIDTDYNNFEVLNIPENHPARDLWDTFYVSSKRKALASRSRQSSKLLLRTHTSNAQIRILKNNKPPIRMMTLGRCFRYENVDARHEHTFEQFEIVYVDKGVSMTQLQYLSEYFFKSILGKDTQARLRPKYYPFVEPGVGVDASCAFCKGKGCKVCGSTGWLELAGAGMIHPKVLKRGGIDPSLYSGIAWGVGIERMTMLKYGIEDLRSLKSGDLKFLEKF